MTEAEILLVTPIGPLRARFDAGGALAFVVPCHRVIGADGSLTGFGGGLPAKRALLELEGAPCVAPRGQMRLVG